MKGGGGAFRRLGPQCRARLGGGDFNIWDGRRHPMRRRGPTGVWEIFIPGLARARPTNTRSAAGQGELLPLKADPVGFRVEHPPANASVVRRIGGELATMTTGWQTRAARNSDRDAPISVYEVHLGSWRRAPGDRMLSYTELAEQLVGYAADMGFTHIELPAGQRISVRRQLGLSAGRPVRAHHPPRHAIGIPRLRRCGAPAGLGVILDWVPGHFPTDAHGLGRFDGTALYEHADPREGFHQDWNTLIYNYGRREVKNYLVSNALYWLEEYHVDGLRVDAVASMLYRDYSRR
jgi:1,4-alpha-glucan branching enzyme